MPEPPIMLPPGILIWNGKAHVVVKIEGHEVIGSPGDLVVSDTPIILKEGTVEIREIIGIDPPGG